HTNIDEFDTATMLVDRALARDPHLPWAWERRGWLHVYAGEAELAISRFARAIRLDTSRRGRCTRLTGIGGAFFDRGRYQLAARWMNRAVIESPGAAWINRTLAVAYLRAGQRPAADRALQAFRRSYPDATIAAVTSVNHFSADFTERVATGLDDLGLPA